MSGARDIIFDIIENRIKYREYNLQDPYIEEADYIENVGALKELKFLKGYMEEMDRKGKLSV